MHSHNEWKKWRKRKTMKNETHIMPPTNMTMITEVNRTKACKHAKNEKNEEKTPRAHWRFELHNCSKIHRIFPFQYLHYIRSSVLNRTLFLILIIIFTIAYLHIALNAKSFPCSFIWIDDHRSSVRLVSLHKINIFSPRKKEKKKTSEEKYCFYAGFKLSHKLEWWPLSNNDLIVCNESLTFPVTS